MAEIDIPETIKALDRYHFKSRVQQHQRKSIMDNPDACISWSQAMGARLTEDVERSFIDKADPGAIRTYMEENKMYSWPQAENKVATSPRMSLWYAMRTQKTFPLGEDAIATDARDSFMYAVDILQHRFLKGEPTIQKTEKLWRAYKRHFVKKPAAPTGGA